jgi:hypothetical protein
VKRLLAALLVLAAAPAAARNWQVAIADPACDAKGMMSVGLRIRYDGPKVPVESPVVRLTEAGGKPRLPRGLVWRSGSKALAALLAGGSVRGLEAGDAVRVEFRFDTREANGPLLLEFGDLPAVALTRKGRACASLLKSPAVPAAQAQRVAAKEPARLRVYRGTYPCGGGAAALRTIEADHPPYLPKQLVVLGRGYLPGVRHVDLPMGAAPAQAYFYSGSDTLDAIELAARRAIAADFPQYASGGYFAFNWGEQRGATGNQIDSIGLYELRACPGADKKAAEKKKGA